MPALLLLPLLWLLGSTGALAAGIEVRTLGGETSTLAAQIRPDRYTVVMMWTTYCHVCKGQYPVLTGFHDAHAGSDAEVLGVSLDGYAELGSVREFVAGKPFSFPTVVAESARMAGAFEAATGEKFTGTPTYLIFDPKRQLVAARAGDLTRDVLERFLRKRADTATSPASPASP